MPVLLLKLIVVFILIIIIAILNRSLLLNNAALSIISIIALSYLMTMQSGAIRIYCMTESLYLIQNELSCIQINRCDNSQVIYPRQAMVTVLVS